MAKEDQRAWDAMTALTSYPSIDMMSEELPTNQIRRMHHLDKNKGKNFVQRILNPKMNKGKEVPWKDEETGESGTMTHFMTSVDNKVIPMVVDKGGKQFHEFTDWKKAYEYALETGEFIETDSPEEADWLSKNYKTEEFKKGY